MTKIKAQMKEAEAGEVKAKLKQRRETEREAFRATVRKVTFFYLIFVHIFSISNIIFLHWVKLVFDIVQLSADDKNS
jgi:hypothetical protein